MVIDMEVRWLLVGVGIPWIRIGKRRVALHEVGGDFDGVNNSMKSQVFKSDKALEKHEAKAEMELNKWLDKYTVSGLSVGRDKDGKVVRMQFNNRTSYQTPMPDEVNTQTVEQNTPVVHDVFVDQYGRKEKAPNRKKSKKGKKPCSACEKKRNWSKLKRLVTGGSKLLMSELGIDAATEDTIIARKELCMACDSYDFGVCNECGCFTAAKVKLNSEECPLGKWATVEVTTDGGEILGR